MMSKAADLDLYYSHKLNKTRDGPAKFMVDLCDNILLGDDKADQIRSQLRVAKKEEIVPLLEDYIDKRGDTLLHKMVQFHKGEELMVDLIRVCPGLINKPRAGEFSGQTALHIAISKGNQDAVAAILNHEVVAQSSKRQELFHACATGDKFRDTVMMGELPLTVAALTLDVDMVELLLDHGAPLHLQNALGDTLMHSLVRYAAVHVDARPQVVHMMQLVHSTLPPRPSSNTSLLRHYSEKKLDPLALWLLENKDGVTALRLAAALGEAEVFMAILALDGVYSQLDEHDGVFDIHLCDITEIDTVAHARRQVEAVRSRKRSKSTSKSSKISPSDDSQQSPLTNDKDNPKSPITASRVDMEVIDTGPPDSTFCGKTRKPKCVLEIICSVKVNAAFDLLRVDVIRNIVKDKWKAYRWIFWIWMMLHFLTMILLTTYAMYKTKVIKFEIYSTGGVNSSFASPEEVSSLESAFVHGVAFVAFVVGAVYLLLEAVRSLYLRQDWQLGLIHHNGLYRLTLVAFSLSLVADSLWYLVLPDHSYLLVLALLLGWWFMTFALRVFKKFSFFTVMVQKVLLGDMLRFSIVILVQLLSFSVAMHITFQSSREVPEEFSHLGKTLMTMFKLMLGLTDIEILYEARHPWMAVALFVVFVLVTYILLINSLIAMMSQTCSLVSEDRARQCELQTLSVILLLESMMPLRYRHCAGAAKYVRKYDIQREQHVQEKRFFRSVTSVQTQYADGKAIVDRENLMRTRGWEDGSLVMASHMDRMASHMDSYWRPGGGPLRRNNTARKRFQSIGKVIRVKNNMEAGGHVETEDRSKNVMGDYSSHADMYADYTEKHERFGSFSKRNNVNMTPVAEDSKQNGNKSLLGVPEADFSKSPKSKRKRHNSDTRNRRIQTDAIEIKPMSKSMPDGEIRRLKYQESGNDASKLTDNLNKKRSSKKVKSEPTDTNSVNQPSEIQPPQSNLNLVQPPPQVFVIADPSLLLPLQRDPNGFRLNPQYIQQSIQSANAVSGHNSQPSQHQITDLNRNQAGFVPVQEHSRLNNPFMRPVPTGVESAKSRVNQGVLERREFTTGPIASVNEPAYHRNHLNLHTQPDFVQQGTSFDYKHPALDEYGYSPPRSTWQVEPQRQTIQPHQHPTYNVDDHVQPYTINAVLPTANHDGTGQNNSTNLKPNTKRTRKGLGVGSGNLDPNTEAIDPRPRTPTKVTFRHLDINDVNSESEV